MLNKIPYLLTVAGMAGGVIIAIFFGVNEDLFKKRIAAGLEHNVQIQAIADPVERTAKLSAEASKDWRYYQRYHVHATGIGAMMLALLLLLGRLDAPYKLKATASYLIAIGGLLYPFVWLFAALYGPQMGRSEAKEAFAIFGYSSGLFVVGILLTLVLVAKYEIRES